MYKVVSAPKKIIFKFQSLSNVHFFKFAYGCLFSYRTAFKIREMLTDKFF